jgi:hypothetical protein
MYLKCIIIYRGFRNNQVKFVRFFFLETQVQIKMLNNAKFQINQVLLYAVYIGSLPNDASSYNYSRLKRPKRHHVSEKGVSFRC